MKTINVIEKYAEMKGITKKDATDIVKTVLDIIQKGVKEDGEVNIANFVKLTMVHKEATKVRSPQTGEMIDVPAKEVPKAKFSKTFKDFLNA